MSLPCVSQKSAGSAATPGVEEVGVLDRPVAVVVLGVHADDRGLDAQVDVLGHQRDARFGVLRLQRQRLREDGVVGAVPG